MRKLPLLFIALITACSSGVDRPEDIGDDGTDDIQTDTDDLGSDTLPPGDDDGDGGDVHDNDPPDELVIDAASSLMVTDRFGFAAVENEFTMGKLLLDIGQFIHEQTEIYNATHEDQRKYHDPLYFAMHTFTGASNDTVNHNEYTGLKVGVTPVIFDTNEEVIVNPGGVEWDLLNDQRGPFRLLAVVNRVDLVGDFDLRGGGQFAGAERRWFGEGRLIFGLTTDLADGPYPMTFIAEYRLPAIKVDTDGSIVVDTSFDYVAGPPTNEAWKEGRKLWASVWAELSRYPRTSSEYQSKLRDIVALFARGAYSAGIRSGERVQKPNRTITDEFEYREHYLNGNWMLSNRKVRREPFRCAQNSRAFAKRIEGDWNEAEGGLNYDYLMGARNLDDKEVTEIAEDCGGELPYAQGDDDDNGGDSNLPPYQLRAKFVRFQLGDVWETRLDEPKRHAFAIGTCTGCHAGETDTEGFQVFPRLANENSRLSTFLTGGAQFTSNGVTYNYNELERRMEVLEHFLALDDMPGGIFSLGH